MNPQNNNELPPVYNGGSESQVPAEQYVPSHEQAAEQARAQAVEHGVAAQPMPMPTPLPMPSQSVQQAPAAPVTGQSAPQMADDLDLIEKEWVDKAKAIVEHTKHDPRAQSVEISRFKAGYLRQRFNKDLKIEEG
jgi:hypothetical protein